MEGQRAARPRCLHARLGTPLFATPAPLLTELSSSFFRITCTLLALSVRVYDTRYLFWLCAPFFRLFITLFDSFSRISRRAGELWVSMTSGRRCFRPAASIPNKIVRSGPISGSQRCASGAAPRVIMAGLISVYIGLYWFGVPIMSDYNVLQYYL